MEVIAKEKCTGCLACYHACGQGAIDIETDDKGFFYPAINMEKCIQCGKCTAICPEKEPSAKAYGKPLKIYACVAKDIDIRKNSTSGGVFYHLAKAVIEDGGIVYGAAFNDDFDVIHKGIDQVGSIPELMGSKYVQSNIGRIYADVQNQLHDHRKCLFSGTPCQVAGLKAFLQTDDPNLLCVDILCHGAPSPVFFKQYRDFIKQKWNMYGNLNNIRFRYKEPGWSDFSMRFVFENGIYQEDKYHDPYLRAFLQNCITRENCHHCIYTNASRLGDITLGDFWGYWSEARKNRNDHLGISLVMVNSPTGEHLLHRLQDQFTIEEKSFSEAAAGNRVLYGCYAPNKCSTDLWKDFHSLPMDQLVKKHLGQCDRVSKKHKAVNWLRDHAYRFPKGFVRIAKRKLVPIKKL